MELRQTIRTGIRNIRRAWWEPGLMLAISALLVAAAWLWIPAPLVENPVQTELLLYEPDLVRIQNQHCLIGKNLL